MHLLRLHLALLGTSITWLGLLLFNPLWLESRAAFWMTALLIVGNFLFSTWMLLRASVPITLNVVQLALFGLLNVQLASALGRDHFEFECAGHGRDWIWFTAAHVFRAADVLDAIDEYVIDVQKIRHRSVTAGILLVGMHLAVDVFVFSLLARRLARYWGSVAENQLEVERKICGWLMLAGGCYVLSGVFQGWSRADWLLWPLDNLLRTIDIGDAFQIFHWQLHHVQAGPWNATLAALFRVSLGMFMARTLTLQRVTHLQGLGLTATELVEALREGDRETRQGAAEGLGRADDDEEALEALAEALRHDRVVEVRRAAAESLGRIDGASHDKVPVLIAALEEIHEDVRAAAVTALVQTGPSALPELATQLREHRCSWVRRAAAEAIVAIGGARTVPLMIEALRDPHENIRLFAIDVLGQRHDGRVTEALFACLEDKCREVSQAAWDALGAMSALPENCSVSLRGRRDGVGPAPPLPANRDSEEHAEMIESDVAPGGVPRQEEGLEVLGAHGVPGYEQNQQPAIRPGDEQGSAEDGEAGVGRDMYQLGEKEELLGKSFTRRFRNGIFHEQAARQRRHVDDPDE